MRILAIFLAILGVLPLAAQVSEPSAASEEFTAPWVGTRAYFNRVFKDPNPRVQLRAPSRLEDYLVDGKLELSLKAYLELVMANNTDIEIQRLSIEMPKNAIQRAFSVFDPLFNANFSATRSKTPAADQLAGAQTVSNLNQPFSVGFQQLLPTGTQVSTNFGWTKTSTNSAFQVMNPAIRSNWRMGFTQPLMRNRGNEITKLQINIARSRLRSSEYNVEDQIMRLLVQAENAYWAVVEARESLKVQEQGLALADQSLKRTMRELELGATSQLEVFQPQQTYATAEIAVTQARYRLAQAEDALRRQMGADLDPRFRDVPIVLTESVLPPTDEADFDKEKLVELALSKRPDLLAARQALDVDDLNIKSASNSLRPQFDLVANYTTQGLGGNRFERQFGDENPILVSTGGFGSSLNQLFGFGFPVFNFGLQLQLPLRDRRASADLADALVQKKLDALRVRQTEQNIRLEVLNAINQVENSRASVKLAQIAVDFANKRLEADQKRYDLGTINIFFLLDAQRALIQAQADLVQQSVQYRRNLLNLLQRTGQLFEERNIVLQH